MKSVYFLAFIAITFATENARANGTSTPVASHGETFVLAAADKLTVQVKIKAHEVQIGEPSDSRPAVIETNCTYSKYPCSIVDRVEITVNGNALFIPRSTFSDLADIYRAEIKSAGKGSVLRLDGGDGSEGYIVKIEFDATHVKRRTLASGTLPTKPLQETRYYTIVEGD